MISLFLVDDHKYLFKGIKDAIEEFDNNMVVVGTATSGLEAIEKLKKARLIFINLKNLNNEENFICLYIHECSYTSDLFV